LGEEYRSLSSSLCSFLQSPVKNNNFTRVPRVYYKSLLGAEFSIVLAY
jgi:hypothetical protein